MLNNSHTPANTSIEEFNWWATLETAELDSMPFINESLSDYQLREAKKIPSNMSNFLRNMDYYARNKRTIIPQKGFAPTQEPLPLSSRAS